MTFLPKKTVSTGFRKGKEVIVMASGNRKGKSVWVDIESEGFKPWRETMRPHYAEYRDTETGDTYWKKFNSQPNMSDMMLADHVIRQTENNTYEYVKNRTTGHLTEVPKEEMAWIILAARKF
jgi:hypothetical protein